MSKFNFNSEEHRDFTKFELSEKIINSDPLEQFGIWFEDAKKADFLDANAMIVATATPDGVPSMRVVLLKSFDDRGYVFYTNYESKKGEDIKANPKVSLLFFWDKLERQVRIEGDIKKLSKEESDKYFQSRPYTSRLGAIASAQSRPLKSRFNLMRRVAELMVKYPANVPLPDHWGGYIVEPYQYEFWQGRKNRLHDRFQYRLEDGVWVHERLSP